MPWIATIEVLCQAHQKDVLTKIQLVGKNICINSYTKSFM